MENDRSDEKAKENADEGFGHSLISATAEFPIRSLEDAFGGKGYRAVNRGRREPNMPIISSGRRPMQIKLPSRLGTKWRPYQAFHAQITGARRCK
jgi:hypothetical protein